jgi:hypothetical protein
MHLEGGRPRIPDRVYLTGILFMLKTADRWEWVSLECSSISAKVHANEAYGARADTVSFITGTSWRCHHGSSTPSLTGARP